MMPDVFDERFVVHDNVRVESYARPSDRFFAPVTADDVENICAFLERLPDGSVLACRGRDLVPTGEWGRFSVPDTWDYGICTLVQGRCFFVWETGVVESWLIRQVDHRRLVHFALARKSEDAMHGTVALSCDRVVVISHGFSPQRGPDYALIRALQMVALRRGFRAVVPSFVESYKFGPSRGRSERVKYIFEEMLCLEEKPRVLALVGHSQGGAASAVACSDRVVRAMNVHGLCLIGAESPHSGRDGAVPKPACGVLRILHARQDGVVAFEELQRLCSVWSVPMMAADSFVQRNSKDAWGDDIHHDFLSKDLLELATTFIGQFLEDVVTVAATPHAHLAYGCTTGATVTFDETAQDIICNVSCQSGIGRVRVRVYNPDHGKSVVVRFALRGLEKATFDNGRVSLALQCQSHGDQLVLQERRCLDSTVTQLAPTDALWCTVTRGPAAIDVLLARDAAPCPEIAIDFVDFYR